MANKYLYHGSNQVVEHPICDMGAKGRDFGVQAVLNSKMYERLITDADFLDEGDIFLFNILSKEIDAN